MIRARAPASVANVFTGFDIMGFSVPLLYDEVILTKNNGGVRIKQITGSDQIPVEASKNTAGGALLSFIDGEDLDFGFDVEITKGIPLGSGLGGSAASAVAAVTAANAFLDTTLSREKLFTYALDGEAIASGGKPHGDNVAASLFGGMTMCIKDEGFIVRRLPVPDVTVLLVHPHLVVKTSEARAVLSSEISMELYVEQSMRHSLFIHALHTKNLDDLSRVLSDKIIEPQRKRFIPHFDDIKEQAMRSGAMGFTISGAGPTLFGWYKNQDQANAALRRIESLDLSYKIDGYITNIDTGGAVIVKE